MHEYLLSEMPARHRGRPAAVAAWNRYAFKRQALSMIGEENAIPEAMRGDNTRYAA
jgi:hypothetical protein